MPVFPHAQQFFSAARRLWAGKLAHPSLRRSRSRNDTVARRLATLALGALLLSGGAARGFDFDRPMDRGGRIGDYLGRVVANSGKRHVIAGDCMSACTMWLGHKGACVTPDAVLWFHSAGDPLQRMRNENPWQAMSPAGNRALLAMYPPRVRAVVEPWLQTPDFHTLSGRELAALGVPLCREQDLAGR